MRWRHIFLSTPPRFTTPASAWVSVVKKTGLYLERDENERKEFLAALEKVPPEKVIWMDESGIDEVLYRPYAYGKKGEKVFFDVTGKHISRTTLIAGYRNGKMIAPWYFKGHTDKEMVEEWCKNPLKSDICEGDVVVADNASFHRHSQMEQLIESYGATMLWMPKYSPDLNKIEPQWANLKQGIRSNNNPDVHFFQKLEAQIIKMAT